MVWDNWWPIKEKPAKSKIQSWKYILMLGCVALPRPRLLYKAEPLKLNSIQLTE